MKTLAKRMIRSCGYDLRKAPRQRPTSISKNNPANGLPQTSLAHLLNGFDRVAVLEPEAVNGNVSLLELLVICTLTARRGARRLFEFGTFDGRTSVNMIANAAPEAELYTLDLPKAALNHTTFALHENDRQYVDKPVPGLRYSYTRWAPRIHQLFGDSATFDYSPYHNQMDVIFIDGSHQYDYVKSDTNAALRLAGSDAVLIWHDYQPCWPGVVRFLNERFCDRGIFSGLHHLEATSLAYLELRR